MYFIKKQHKIGDGPTGVGLWACRARPGPKN